jgi:inositol-hexakisphosphate/diphosphoinositol-pentakisphosphate 1-kinase
VTLTPHEKFLAKKIVKIFKQNVIGFDLLRSGDHSYICDVNGWSFVKGNTQYYEDCALILKRMLLKKFCPSKLGELDRKNMDNIFQKLKKRNYRPKEIDHQHKEELRSVVAIYRHGDRTPK